MRYAISASLLVAAIVVGLIWGPDYWEQWRGEETEGSQPDEAGFVDLASPPAPDYETVVTDEAQAQQLAQEAQGYLADISQPEQSQTNAQGNAADQGPLLLTAQSELSWAGEDGSVAELLDRYGIAREPNQLYYAHRVVEADDQGVWGIVQGGLITRFAEGVAANRGDNQQVYKLLIPKRADERQDDGSSSFLGKVIWHKTTNASVVNTTRGLARPSSELVVPQQDLVIVGFAPEELVAIYQYFAVRGQR